MSTYLSPSPFLHFDDNNGNPASGYKLFTYLTRTTTKANTYTDSSGTTPNTNPIILDSRGECDCWLPAGQLFTYVLSPPTDTDPPTNPIKTRNDIGAGGAVATINYAVDSGAVNSYVATVANIPALFAGLAMTLQVGLTDTGPSTLNLNALGPKPIQLQNGGALGGGELQGGGQYLIQYTGSAWQVLGLSITPDKVRTPMEVAVGVEPVSYLFIPGDPRRYGAVMDGVTDDTVALQNWAKVGGQLTWPVAQTSLISGEVILFSNTTLNFVKGGGMTTATHGIAFLRATSQNNVEVYGGTFTQTSAGAGFNYTVGGLVFDTCTHCRAEGNNFVGMQNHGVLLLASSFCLVRGNYFTSFLGQNQDASDIAVLSNLTLGSAYNVIDSNFCYGGGEHGIAVYDPYSGVLPVRNTVCNNKIGTHTGYGILCYLPDAGDSYNEFTGNYIEEILGFWTNGLNSNNSAGNGIYVVGMGGGGTLIANNTIRDCCISTANATLAPAGIGISGISAGAAPITVTGNTITDMPQYNGILFTGVLSGGTVVGNTVRMPAANVNGGAIGVTNCNGVTVNGNMVSQLNTTTAQRCITVTAQAANASNCAVVGNTVIGGHYSQIEIGQSGGFKVTGLVINGNVLSGGDNSCIPLLLGNASCANATITGNTVTAGNAAALSHTACTNVRYANNFFQSNSTPTLSFSGLNTGSFYDKSNFGSGSGAGVSNAGTGLMIEMLAAAVPVAGTWALYDRIQQNGNGSGSPKGWVCTTAGGTGTFAFTSEGNL